MSEPGSPEQRRLPRVNRSFMVRYRAVGHAQGNWFVSPLRDLSSHGARFLSEQPFAVGSLLEVALVLPTVSKPILVQAKIVWAKPWRVGLTELGVAFDAGDDAAQQLRASVTRFLRKETR